MSNELNVLSLNGSGKQALNASRALTEGRGGSAPGHGNSERRRSPWVIAQPQVTPHDVLQQSDSLGLHQLVYHIAQHRPHGIEPLVRMADIRQTGFVQQDLLDDEDRNGLGELRAGLHDPQAERDYLRREQEVYHGRVVVLL